MAEIATTPSKVRPLVGAIIKRKTAGGSGEVGDAIYVASDGDVEQADADALASAQMRGIVVAVGVDGATAFVAGDPLDVVFFGPVELGASGLTDGAVFYVSPTAGKLDQTAPAASGDYPFIGGWAWSDTAVFVDPQVAIPTVNP